MLNKTAKPGFGRRLIPFIAIFCLIASLTAVQQGRLFGVALPPQNDSTAQTLTVDGDKMIIDTSIPGKDITGYGGPVPLRIYTTAGRIDSVSALPNSETPSFFGKVGAAGLPHKWDGLSLQEAAALQVDAVSGATYSSTAYIANLRAGVNYALGESAAAHHSRPVSASAIAALVIILCGAILPLKLKGTRFRLILQLANVCILGFWAGTFVDYAMMFNFFANAPVFTLSFITTALLLIVALLYPLFGKPGHYCSWVCPFGSIQELAGHLSQKKLHLSPGTLKILTNVRLTLWIVLMLLLFIGWGASWIDYEIFTAFIVKSASWVVIAVGAAFILLSIFIPRPFCRFVCPTGSLLKEV